MPPKRPPRTPDRGFSKWFDPFSDEPDGMEYDLTERTQQPALRYQKYNCYRTDGLNGTLVCPESQEEIDKEPVSKRQKQVLQSQDQQDTFEEMEKEKERERREELRQERRARREQRDRDDALRGPPPPPPPPPAPPVPVQ